MGKDEDPTAGATTSRDSEEFRENAEKRQEASFGEKAAGVLKSDPATDMEGEIVDKMSGDKDDG
ncbi:MAG: hypothetical protein M3198_04235 [Actinomycetota bacterium]|nr:hypothetical protein [Actinomycetota bacterium]